MKRSEEIICIAELTVKNGKKEELLLALAKLIPLSKKEIGCIRYELHESIENPSVITFVDRFKDQAAFDFHCETDYIKSYFDNIIPPLVDEIRITTYREIDI